MPQHTYYNDPTRLVATQNEVTSILPASSGAWAGWEAPQQPYKWGDPGRGMRAILREGTGAAGDREGSRGCDARGRQA